MCGLFGLISCETAFKPGPKFIRDAFVAGSVRGTDSAGIFAVNAKGSIESHKQLGSGASFVQNDVAEALIEAADTSWATFGHNRSATTGGIKGAAAHPFIFYNANDEPYFAGMHNGTIQGWTSAKHVSDTHWALDELAKHGKDGLGKLNGTYVFVWTDQEDDPEKIHIARNKDRPIHMAFVEGGKTVLFASESGMLFWLAERNNIKLEENTAFLLDEEHVYSFPIKSPRNYTKSKIIKQSTAAPPRQPTTTHYPSTQRHDTVSAVRGILSAPVSTREEDDRSEIVDAPFELTPTDPVIHNEEMVARVAQEIENAKELGYLGEKFEFDPIEYSKDEQIMYGVCYKSENPVLAGDHKPLLIDAKVLNISERLATKLMEADRIQGICGRVALDTEGQAGPEVILRRPLEFTLRNGNTVTVKSSNIVEYGTGRTSGDERDCQIASC